MEALRDQQPSAEGAQAFPTTREGPSPFLPGTVIQYAWDSTSLGWLKKCPRLYRYQMVEGWRPKTSSVHLRFGILYHQGLELYDRHRAEGVGHEESLIAIVGWLLEATWDAEGPWDTGLTDKNRFTLIRSVVWYLDQFGEADPAQTVVLANGKPAVELSFKMELDWGPAAAVEVTHREHPGYQAPEEASQPYLLCGHLDRIVSFLGGTYVMDRKTTKTTISQYYFDSFEPSNQMTLYTIAAKVIFETPVRGVIIDGAQIAVGFTRFARGFTYRTDAQIEEWLADLSFWLNAAEHYATSGNWPMNDTACFGCAFRNICSKDPSVRQNFLESDFTQEDPWNPLRSRG